MTTELRFIASFSASCFHCATAMIDGRLLVDRQLAESMHEAVEGLRKSLAAAGLSESVAEHLCALSAGIENNRELAQVTLTKVLGRAAAGSDAVARLARELDNVETAFRLAVPGVVDELSRRGEPLMSQWEARGPGMLSELARLTEQGLLVERADVVLVYPVTGGGGAAHPPYNSVRLEAVLADPHPQLPEVVRLAWLVSSLNVDLPMYGDHLPGARQTAVGTLAMLPAALRAGEYVELTRLDRATVELAIEVWGLAEGLAAGAVDHLLDWWETYQESRPPWAVALGALDRMLYGREVQGR